jgi:uncharacterized protein (DUF433 family)
MPVSGSRVPLTGIAFLWKEGASAEYIVENYPSLSLPQVYGALAFYLEHRMLIDQHQSEDRMQGDAAQQALRDADPDRYADLERRFAAVRAQLAKSAS